MRIALYSGSFNPIHNAHLALCRYLMEKKPAGIEQVWLMVTPRNPLKPDLEMATDKERIDMASLAVENLPGVEVSDFEMTLSPPYYSLRTLDALSEKYPQHSFTLVIGSDNWKLISKWYKPEEIISRFGLLIYPRPGYPIENPEKLPQNVVYLSDAPQSDISSTLIREKASNGDDFSHLVPENVLNYIQQKKLY